MEEIIVLVAKEAGKIVVREVVVKGAIRIIKSIIFQLKKGRKKMKKDLLKAFGKVLLVSALMFVVKSLEDKGTANRGEEEEEEDFEIIDEEEYEDGD